MVQIGTVHSSRPNRSALEPRAAGGPSTQVTPLIASGPSKVPARDVESTNMFGYVWCIYCLDPFKVNWFCLKIGYSKSSGLSSMFLSSNYIKLAIWCFTVIISDTSNYHNSSSYDMSHLDPIKSHEISSHPCSWANYNNSLTWIKAIKGDDFPDPNYDFQGSLVVSSWWNLPRCSRSSTSQWLGIATSHQPRAMAAPRALIGFGLLLRFRGELLGLLGPGDERSNEARGWSTVEKLVFLVLDGTWCWFVVEPTPLKNMKVSWGYYS